MAKGTLLFLVFCCIPFMLYSQKRKSDKYPVPTRIDTTIVLINIGDLNKDDAASLVNSISNDVKIIGIIADFYEGEDLELKSALLGVKDKLVLSCSLNKIGKNEPAYLEGLEYGPDLIYLDKKDVVKAFAFNHRREDGLMIESFYLKMAKKINPSYRRYEYDSALYDVQYIGNKNCFYVLTPEDVQDVIPGFWKDKIILIGYLGSNPLSFVSDDVDAFFTPTSRWSVPKGMPNMYATVLAANILSFILSDVRFR